MTYLCITVENPSGKLVGVQVSDPLTCPVGSWLSIPAEQIFTTSNIQSMLDGYFAFDPDTSALLMVAYLTLWIVGYGTGRAVAGMRRV
jgi:hypothetical protein